MRLLEVMKEVKVIRSYGGQDEEIESVQTLLLPCLVTVVVSGNLIFTTRGACEALRRGSRAWKCDVSSLLAGADS